MNSPVDTIKERIGIEEIISSYIKLDRSGANFKARCPFHNEKTPSFFVSPERNNYYCFGCGAKGDIFTFVEEFEGLDFRGALKMLAVRAGVKLESYNPKEENEKEKLYRIMDEATVFFEKNLSLNKEILDYIKDRGINEKSVQDFRIGFALDDWQSLHNYLKNKNFSDLDIEKAGLIKKNENRYYDRFRARIMFPISDSSGRIIAFSGRIIKDDPEQAKYLNSPETPIFSKSAVLFGIDKAKDSIRKNNFSILVEGQMDLVLSHQAGFKNTVATSGTALSEDVVSKEHSVNSLGLIRRLSSNIVLAFDADKAGVKAVQRAGKIALSLGMDVKCAQMDEGCDPADTISKQGIDAWREAIKNSKHIIEFMLNRVIKESDNDKRKLGRLINEKVLPYINALDSSIEKMHFVKKISDACGITEGAIMEDLKKVEKENLQQNKEIIEVQKKESQIFRKDYIERRLVGILFWRMNIEKENFEFKEITEKLNAVFQKYEKDKPDLIFEAEIFYANNTDFKKEINELLKNWEEENLNEELSLNMQKLANNTDKTEEGKILKEIERINKRKQEIKGRRN